MKLISVVLLCISFSLSATTKQSNVIYGQDNREDVYKVSNEQFKQLAESTAAMIDESSVKQNGSALTVTGPTLLDRGMCPSERFANQITAANCSGFLIDKDLIATAGHCLRSQADCERYVWVFNYKQKDDKGGPVTVAASDVYQCKKLIKSVVDSTTKNDFAIVQLTKATNKRPLKFRTEGAPEVGTSVVVIGHPTGLPTKVADGAKVRSTQQSFFVANLDTYGGNSGSAVFNASNGIVEGILVRGETDYVRTSAGCIASNVCKDSECRGEDVTYSKALVETLKLIRR